MPDERKQKDISLVEKCINGDVQSQKELFQLYYSKMLAICDRYAKDRDDAKDALQDGFIKVFENLHTFNFKSSLEHWIRRIMVNMSIDKYRKKVSEPFKVDVDKVYDLSIEEEILTQLDYEDLLVCVQELPHGYQTVFNLYVIEGFSHQEIGEMLGISAGTSKSQLHKARHQLQEAIKQRLIIRK
ncbi:MAG: sigma-70 family RNA polymerase sigma factor [Bacteroidia bacterium]